MTTKLHHTLFLRNLFCFSIRHRFFWCDLSYFWVTIILLTHIILKSNFVSYCDMFPSTLLCARTCTPTISRVEWVISHDLWINPFVFAFSNFILTDPSSFCEATLFFGIYPIYWIKPYSAAILILTIDLYLVLSARHFIFWGR